ncbi:MAG: hypothetical protein IJ348_02465 [Alistipes sp.]|nr:hypothetical protein [Alistipes sp.]
MIRRLLPLICLLLLCSAARATELPTTIETGVWRAGHIQGIAVDNEQRYIYYSFTTVLVKADMEGNVIGTVTGLLGHLGCLEFNRRDGRLYGSLEYKNDSIGKGILNREGVSGSVEDGFYVAIFDVEKIDRIGMSAERDGVMKCVFLPTVLADYKAVVPTEKGDKTEHRFGCSGFDGISFGPDFGKSDGREYLTITYGIYCDNERSDNDYQVLLQYDTRNWHKYEAPLSQENMHRRGPAKPRARYFVYTGNTSWGVQNLEYDRHTGLWLMAAYKGKKPHFENFTLFAIDGTADPQKGLLEGVRYTKRERILPLAERGTCDARHPQIRGWHFLLPATGIESLGDGLFYISHRKKSKAGEAGTIGLYRFVGTADKPFERIER